MFRGKRGNPKCSFAIGVCSTILMTSPAIRNYCASTKCDLVGPFAQPNYSSTRFLFLLI